MLPFIRNLFRKKRPNHIHWYRAFSFEITPGFHKSLAKEWKCNCGSICDSIERNKYSDYIIALKLSFQEQINYNLLWEHEYPENKGKL